MGGRRAVRAVWRVWRVVVEGRGRVRLGRPEKVVMSALIVVAMVCGGGMCVFGVFCGCGCGVLGGVVYFSLRVMVSRRGVGMMVMEDSLAKVYKGLAVTGYHTDFPGSSLGGTQKIRKKLSRGRVLAFLYKH